MGEVNERRVVAERLGDGESPTGATAAPQAEAPDAQDKATDELAHAWLAAFIRGDIDAMTKRSGYPFRSTAGVAAKGREALSHMLASLVAETPGRAASPVSVETAASLRKLVGKLPPGLDDGSGGLFAVTRVDGDMMILLMTKTSGAWKVTGLVRR